MEQPKPTMQDSMEQVRDILASIRSGLAAPPNAEFFAEYLRKLRASADEFNVWRHGFRDKAEPLAKAICASLNQHRKAGFLAPEEVRWEAVRDAFSTPVDAAQAATIFERFSGPAAGDLRIVTPDRKGGYTQAPTPLTYSIWGPVLRDKGLVHQKITASNINYVDPEILPPLAYGQTDLIYNAWTPELGLVSWSHFFRNHNDQLRSIGYELGGRLMWVNEIVTPELKGRKIQGDERELVFSIDYRADEGSRQIFNVYAMHLMVNFKAGTANFLGPILQMRNAVVPGIAYRACKPALAPKLTLKIEAHQGRVNSVGFSPDGASVISGGQDALVKVWKLKGALAAPVHQFQMVLNNAPRPVTSAVFSPDGTAIVLAHHADPQQAAGTNLLTTAAFGQPANLVGHTADSPCAVFSRDGTLIATCSLDGTARLWDVATHQELAQMIGHVARPAGQLPAGIWTVAFSPDCRRLASGGSDGTIRVWDIAGTPPLPKALKALEAGAGLVFSVDYSPHGLLASAHEDGSVILWDTTSWNRLATLKGHNDWTVGVRFSSDGLLLISASKDWTARIWDASGHQVVASLDHPGPVHSAAISIDNLRAVTGCEDGKVRIWQLHA